MEFINSIDEESLRHKLCIFTGLQVVAFIGAMIFFGDFYADSGLFIPFFIYLLITFVECISGGFFRIIEAFKFAVGSVTAILTLSLIPDVKKGYSPLMSCSLSGEMPLIFRTLTSSLL